MARKRKAKSKTLGNRRRVGAARAGNLKDVAVQGLVIAGVAVGMDILAGKVMPSMDKKLKGVLVAGGGALVGTMLIKGPMGTNFALGSLVAGTKQALQGFGVLSGVGANYLPYAPIRLNGPGINAQVNGPGIPAMVNGGQTITAKVNGLNGVGRSSAYRYMG